MPRSPTLPELRFVVVGARGAGKSTFIHHALDLKKPLHAAQASKKMSLEGDVFMIRLTEIQLQDVNVDDDYVVSWPHLPDVEEPRIDGVLALYDIARRDTLAGVPDLLNACSRSNLPCVLVACKCDLPSASRKIDPREVEKSCMRETGIEGCQTFRDRPESHKRCISVVLRNVISNETATRGNPRRVRAATQVEARPQPATERPNHTRAASEQIVTQASNNAIGDLGIRANHASDSSSYAPGYFEPYAMTMAAASARGNREVESEPEATTATTPLGVDDKVPVESEPSAQDRSSRPRSRLRPGTPVTIANSLIDGDGNSSTDQERDDDEPPLPKPPPAVPDSSADGKTFDELVDRLVSLPMTKEDANFNEAFLCLYRKFASPAQLLAGFLERWEALGRSDEPHILILHSQLRIISLLSRWVVEYPGDFAYLLTHHYLTQFCERLSEDRLFATAANEIFGVLQLAIPDPDLAWSVTDQKVGDDMIKTYFKEFPDLHGSSTAQDGQDWFENVDDQLDQDTPSSMHLRMASSTTSPIGGLRSASFSSSSFHTIIDSIETAKTQAQLITPLSRVPLTKIQWHQFMDFSDDDLASELTRMDWIMYSAIQVRDLIRHVSLSPSEKEGSRSLDHLNRMINHFNHVAFWTSSVILIRDKAKHRAKALSKFIEVAKKLRSQNNYNSLAAIIAGINSISVHRLAQTREQVPQISQKELMQLEILMGTRKGYFAYRMAWDNTLGEKLPFLPLHLRDFVATEEGNPTFLDKAKERINWKKFAIMGDTVVSIQQSQGNPYPHIAPNAEIRRLILDGKVSMDDEELYERSLQVEPRGPNEPRKKLNLFQR